MVALISQASLPKVKRSPSTDQVLPKQSKTEKLFSARAVNQNHDFPKTGKPARKFDKRSYILDINVGLSFNFLRTGIKRSHSVPSQDYTADDSSNRCFGCSKMQLFELMCESSHCRCEE